MNAKDRKQLQNLISQIDDIKVAIEDMLDYEQEKYDNLPDGIRDSERGDNMYNAIDVLENAVNSLDETIDGLNEIA